MSSSKLTHEHKIFRNRMKLPQHGWLVVKVGTSTIAPEGDIDVSYLESLARQIAFLRDEYWIKTILVTSGAIKAGLKLLGFNNIYRLDEKQAAASIGQFLLMNVYHQAFSQHTFHVGQVLLTRQDCEDRERAENIKQTFQRLFSWASIPIVNENDTVTTEEIKYGDNDILAAHVAIAAGCKAVILLTDIEGFVKDPGRQDACFIPCINKIAPWMIDQAKNYGANGSGGMVTKLQAAQMLNANHIPLVIAHGRIENVLPKIIEGQPIGTIFG